jgi:Domain of unknown function (DUF4394)/PEP-CTERM motif
MKLRASLTFAAIMLGLAASESRAALAYMISGDTESLLRFDTANPGVVSAVGNFSGAVSGLQGLDFRPANGLLYGYADSSNAIVLVDPTNAVTTFISTPATGSNSFNLGIDFNPAADRLRLVNVNDQNLRINVDTGVTIVDGTLAYGAGDPNFGVNPQINEAAYTNNDSNPGTGTQLFYIDIGTDTLVTTTNPNAGALATVGSLGVNTDLLTGFDIFTDPFTGVNRAFAVMRVGGVSTFYSVDLATGAATSLGAFGINNTFGLAIQPAAAVPEPGTALAGLIALGACGAARRRRSSR